MNDNGVMALDISIINLMCKMLVWCIDRCNSIDLCSQDKTSDEGMDIVHYFYLKERILLRILLGLFSLSTVQYNTVIFSSVILEKGLDVNQVNSNNETLLHAAVVSYCCFAV